MIKIIVAEDDFRVANIHEGFLNKIDHVQVVGKAMNGQETLELVQSTDFDLLFLDIYLPDILGTELIDQLREIKPDLDIIMITAATEKHLLEDSLRKGIVNYIMKPASLEKFQEAINQYFNRQSLLAEQDHIDEELLNKIFSNQTNSIQSPKQNSLPKGIDKITLEKVIEHFDDKKGPWSADEMGQAIGSSRTTARRYLEYLVSTEYIKVEQEYGVIGRPERKYYAK
ncbi:response regulator [Piscibacillus halophilus]|uniref:response regulator n=1 Tax=Piscibacillus halophilus TaxID=571933 RepID=UPI00158CFE6E|nr:response regulator [Piscibacillus halophilus]